MGGGRNKKYKRISMTDLVRKLNVNSFHTRLILIRVQMFSSSEGNWTELAPMPASRAGACGVTLLDYFITIGGGTDTVVR